MAKLGGAYIPNLGPNFGDAVTPAAVNHYRETPTSVKFDHATGDFAGFTVTQDSKKWDEGVYGVVAVGTETFASLPAELRANTMNEARTIAEKLNNPRSTPSITVKPATNQSRKF